MAATKEVVVSPGVAIEVAGDAWDDADTEVIEGIAPRFPEAKLIQKAVPDIPESGKHSGEFWLSDIREFRPFLSGVIIAVQQTRVCFDDRDRNAPVCASDDGIAPRPNMPLWDGDKLIVKNEEFKVPARVPLTCAGCDFSKWREDENGNRIPPPCAKQYSTLFEDSDTMGLYRSRFKGTGVADLESLLRSLAGEGVRRGAKKIGRPIYSKRVTITSAEGRKGDWLWFYPEITVDGDVDPKLAPEYIGFARQVRGEFREVVAATHAEDDEHADALASDDGWNDA